MNDYFDRLTYIKYMSLFEKASQEALEYENVDIKSIMTAQQKEAEYIYETKQEIKDILESYDRDTSLEAEEMKAALRQRLKEATPTKIPLNAGEYTKSAVMYYNAARATMYALDETSTMADVVRALPKVERDYYMAFLQERDPEKRKEIMSYASPQLRKALKMAWYQEFEDPESNESYFASHNLPGPLWSGWDPNTDLADVQAKIIKNEGMMSSDFGVYASQYSDPNVINAPYVDYKDGGDGFIVSAMKIQSLLNGYGLTDVDVRVEPSQDSRLDVIANVGRIVAYDIESGISNLFS
jgi:hypothetical protein